jgi:hypothetical protein
MTEILLYGYLIIQLLSSPNGKRMSRARRLPTNQDENHVKRFSQTARVFGVGSMRLLVSEILIIQG